MLGGRRIRLLGRGILLKFAEMLRKKSNVIRAEITLHERKYKNNAIRVLK